MAPYGALWYTAHFYSQFFLDRMVGLGGAAADGLMLLVAGVGIFEYVFFGWLSDKVGRKRVVLPAMALSVAALFPFFQMMTEALNPQILEAGARAPVIVAADPATCSFEFDPVGARRFLSSCDLARGALAARGIGFQREALPKGALALVTIGDRLVPGVEARGLSGRALQEAVADFDARLSDVLDAAGYPLSADPSGRGLPFAVVALLFLVTFANAVAAPSAAMLTELVPTALRYRGTALSGHMGVGWFGAFLPAAATALVADTGDINAGLWYPFAVGLVGVFVLLFFMPETRGIALQEVALGGREEPERRAEKGDAR
jgi:nitrate/nitrite transporter NarK